MNGIETYAEQVALAAAAAGHPTTLLTTTPRVAAAVRARAEGVAGLTVRDLGLRAPGRARGAAERVAPALHTRRVGRALRAALLAGGPFDVAHLNRPRLAPHVRGAVPSVCCAAWFFPHAAGPRLTETWRHSRGPVARRAAATGKAVAHFLGDASGYAAATVVVACTATLAAQLRRRGIRAVACPPPAQGAAAGDAAGEPARGGELALLVCSGDLGHPRKNLADAVRAAASLAGPARPVVLRAVGRHPARLEAAARDAGPHFRLEPLGPLAPPEVRREMRRAHALLLPSLYEEWGYVAVESILSGTPVVTYPVYPFADMLAGGLGVVAAGRTVAAFAAAIAAATGLTPEPAAAPRARGPALAAAGAARFGGEAVGRRLTTIWQESFA